MAAPDRKTQYQIDPTCNACKLHTKCKAVCLSGRNTSTRRRLVVFTDYPDYFADNARKPYALDTGKILDWMFQRMGVDPNEVGYDYTLRCYGKTTLPTTKAGRADCILECNHYRFASIAKTKPKAIAVLGQTSLEAFTGKTRIGDFQGRKTMAWEGVVRKYVPHVWVGYSLQYILVSPSDTVSVFRVLYRAAEEAGLNPKANPSVPPFKWPNIL